MTRRVVRPHIITLPCPRLLDDGCACEADVDVALEYEAPDRSIGERGGYTVMDVAGRCTDGHEFTFDEYATLQTQADRAAREETLDRAHAELEGDR